MPCGKTYTALVARAGAGRTQPDAAPRTTAVFRKGRKGMALTWVWVGMVCVALIYGAATGQSAAVGAAAEPLILEYTGWYRSPSSSSTRI